MIDYLQGRLDADSLASGLVSASWDMQSNATESARDLASSLQLALFELSSGHATEREFRSELQSLVENVESIFQVYPADAAESPAPHSATTAYQLHAHFAVLAPT